MARINVEIASGEAQQAISGMADVLANPRLVFEDIGEYVIESTKQRFNKGIAPSGVPWAPNRPTTLARKKGTRPLIGNSGRLGREIIKFVADNSVEIGSALEYAAVMHFGAKQGQFGTSTRGGPIPWGNIPARVIFGLSEDDVRAVVDIVEEHLLTAV